MKKTASIVIMTAFAASTPHAFSAVKGPSPEAVVTNGDIRWTFRPATDTNGFTVDLAQDDRHTTYRVDCDGKIGRVLDLAATAGDFGGGYYGVGVALASRLPAADKIEYRFAWALTNEIDSAKPWLCSKSLLEAPPNDPFNVLSISIPQGDSLMVTLQRLTRVGPNENSIETHVILNHCPMAIEKMLNELCLHYSCTMTQPNSAPADPQATTTAPSQPEPQQTSDD